MIFYSKLVKVYQFKNPQENKKDGMILRDKIDVLNNKNSKDLLKNTKFFNATIVLKEVTEVKVIHFPKIYDHLLDNGYLRLFLKNAKL